MDLWILKSLLWTDKTMLPSVCHKSSSLVGSSAGGLFDPCVELDLGRFAVAFISRVVYIKFAA